MSAASLLANVARQRSRMALKSPSLWSSAQTANAPSLSPAAASFREYSILATTAPSVVSREHYGIIPDSRYLSLCLPRRIGGPLSFSSQTCWMSTAASVMEDVTDLEEEDSGSENSKLFSSLDNLNPRTLTLLESQGMQEMTEIQAKTWDAVSTGRDVVARSRTGSGTNIHLFLGGFRRFLFRFYFFCQTCATTHP